LLFQGQGQLALSTAVAATLQTPFCGSRNVAQMMNGLELEGHVE
jgi:hypothetical protein